MVALQSNHEKHMGINIKLYLMWVKLCLALVKSFIWNYRIKKFKKKQKQPLKKVFWKSVVMEILKNNSQLLTPWAESMENTSKEVNFQ